MVWGRNRLGMKNKRSLWDSFLPWSPVWAPRRLQKAGGLRPRARVQGSEENLAAEAGPCGQVSSSPWRLGEPRGPCMRQRLAFIQGCGLEGAVCRETAAGKCLGPTGGRRGSPVLTVATCRARALASFREFAPLGACPAEWRLYGSWRSVQEGQRDERQRLPEDCP